MIVFFSRHVSTTTNSSVSSIPAVSSLQFPVHFFPFPHFSLRIFPFFPRTSATHTHDFGVSPFLLLLSSWMAHLFVPGGDWKCACELPTCLSSCVTICLLACALERLVGLDGEFVSFVFGWILAESVLIGCSTFLSALPLSAIHCLCTEAALRPFNRRRRISYPIHTNASTIPRLQCFIISQFLLQPPKLCIPFQLFSSPHSWTERFKSYIDCTYYISLFLHIASSLSHHHQHTIFPLSPPLYSKTDETETHCITPLLTPTSLCIHTSLLTSPLL